ncbi:hypothetical protein KCU73_g88, partial [Aureobasidium melanogenum]
MPNKLLGLRMPSIVQSALNCLCLQCSEVTLQLVRVGVNQVVNFRGIESQTKSSAGSCSANIKPRSGGASLKLAAMTIPRSIRLICFSKPQTWAILVAFELHASPPRSILQKLIQDFHVLFAELLLGVHIMHPYRAHLGGADCGSKTSSTEPRESRRAWQSQVRCL